MQSDGSQLSLHELKDNNARADISAQNPDVTKNMTEKLTAIWNTIRYMRENNKPGNDEQPGSIIK